MRIIASLVFVFLLTSAVVNAQSDADVWKKISTPRNEVTFSVPSDFLVRNDDESNVLYYRGSGVLIRFYVKTTPQAMTELTRSRVSRVLKPGEKESSFKIGAFEGDFRIDEKRDYTISFQFASKTAYYSFFASAPTSENTVLERFMNSVRLADRPLTKQSSPSEDKSTATDFTKLETSPAIRQALNKKASGHSPVEYVDAALSDTPADGNKPVYSRPLLILYQPKAVLLGGSKNESVMVKIALLVDGSVGRIKVISGKKPSSFARQAARAASGIKFLPPEQDGKPVETEITREYTYTIFDSTGDKQK